jgi:hypothetical protein
VSEATRFLERTLPLPWDHSWDRSGSANPDPLPDSGAASVTARRVRIANAAVVKAVWTDGPEQHVLRQMRYFVAVAEHGNFTRAADELHVAQQAVSQQIRALEATLGATLFRRNSRNVELTPEGEVFLADARRVLAASDTAVRRVQAASRGETGTLRLVYTILAAYETTPALLKLLRTRHPQLKLGARARSMAHRFPHCS